MGTRGKKRGGGGVGKARPGRARLDPESSDGAAPTTEYQRLPLSAIGAVQPIPASVIAPESPIGRLLSGAGRRRGLLLLGLAVLGGLMVVVAAPDFDLWPLAWLALLPTLIAIEAASTTRRAALLGWVSGIAVHVGGFYWVTGMLVRFAHLPRPVAIVGLLLLGAYQGLVFLLFAWAVRQVRRRSAARRGQPLPMVIVAPVAMVAFELLVPFLFPCSIAITQAWVVPVIQIAELTGAHGVSALLVLCAAALYDALSSTSRRRRLTSLGGAAALVALALIYGFARIGQIEERRAAAPTIQVGVVQGNISFDEKGLHHPRLAAGQLGGLQKVSAELQAKGADLVLWSESSYPYAIGRNRTKDFDPGGRGRLHTDDFNAPLVLGALTRTSSPGDLPYNSAIYVDREGSFRGRFDKIFLLLFGEYIPFHDLLKDIVPRNAGHFARGQSIVTFPFEHEGATYRLGPMICYEDILPGFGRELSELHPHLLVNLTNDAWYGDTSEPWQHLALSVYRSVEARADLVRAVNTGVSAFIDATGRVYEQSYAVDPKEKPTPMSGHLAEVALMESGHTVFAAVGNLFAWLCVAATGLLWLVPAIAARVRRRR